MGRIEGGGAGGGGGGGPFLRFCVLRIELVDVVVIQVEWLSVLSWFCNLRWSVLYGLVEQSVADEVDESVRRHSHLVL